MNTGHLRWFEATIKVRSYARAGDVKRALLVALGTRMPDIMSVSSVRVRRAPKKPRAVPA